MENIKKQKKKDGTTTSSLASLHKLSDEIPVKAGVEEKWHKNYLMPDASATITKTIKCRDFV